MHHESSLEQGYTTGWECDVLNESWKMTVVSGVFKVMGSVIQILDVEKACIPMLSFISRAEYGDNEIK